MNENIKVTYKSFDEMPLSMNAQDVAMALNVSKITAYDLMHSKGFPTIFIGQRMIVPKDKFIKWYNEQGEQSGS